MSYSRLLYLCLLIVSRVVVAIAQLGIGGLYGNPYGIGNPYGMGMPGGFGFGMNPFNNPYGLLGTYGYNPIFGGGMLGKK
ncbi:hypothetical protein RB195_014706 [Necator americanus]|uniref:Uncharacterized protein n=1 Tax=Necator americanus TaxID=51031 RepID=A0ABR1E2Z3_NECAM